MDQIFIFIIVALFWAAKAWWDKQQEKLAAEELERRQREEQARPPAARGELASSPDQRFRNIQEEIRRRIAERQGQTPPVSAPPRRPAQPARPMAQPSPRPMVSPQPVYRSSPPPPLRPAPVLRHKPTPQIPQPHPVPVQAPQPMPTPVASGDSEAYAIAPVLEDAVVLPDADTAYEIPAEGWTTRLSVLRAALSAPNAARQAFLMREIFDKPLCLRRAPGGHEDWN